MMIPYVISAIASPFLGGIVDKFGFRATLSGLVTAPKGQGARVVLCGALDLARDHPAARIVVVSHQGTVLDLEGGRIHLRQVGTASLERALTAEAP